MLLYPDMIQVDMGHTSKFLCLQKNQLDIQWIDNLKVYLIVGKNIVRLVDSWVLGTVEEDGKLEVFIDTVTNDLGLGEVEGACDGNALPIGIHISSDVKFPSSWKRVKPKYSL